MPTPVYLQPPSLNEQHTRLHPPPPPTGPAPTQQDRPATPRPPRQHPAGPARADCPPLTRPVRGDHGWTFRGGLPATGPGGVRSDRARPAGRVTDRLALSMIITSSCGSAWPSACCSSSWSCTCPPPPCGSRTSSCSAAGSPRWLLPPPPWSHSSPSPAPPSLKSPSPAPTAALCSTLTPNTSTALGQIADGLVLQSLLPLAHCSQSLRGREGGGGGAGRWGGGACEGVRESPVHAQSALSCPQCARLLHLGQTAAHSRGLFLWLLDWCWLSRAYLLCEIDRVMVFPQPMVLPLELLQLQPKTVLLQRLLRQLRLSPLPLRLACLQLGPHALLFTLLLPELVPQSFHCLPQTPRLSFLLLLTGRQLFLTMTALPVGPGRLAGSGGRRLLPQPPQFGHLRLQLHHLLLGLVPAHPLLGCLGGTPLPLLPLLLGVLLPGLDLPLPAPQVALRLLQGLAQLLNPALALVHAPPHLQGLPLRLLPRPLQLCLRLLPLQLRLLLVGGLGPAQLLLLAFRVLLQPLQFPTVAGGLLLELGGCLLGCCLCPLQLLLSGLVEGQQLVYHSLLVPDLVLGVLVLFPEVGVPDLNHWRSLPRAHPALGPGRRPAPSLPLPGCLLQLLLLTADFLLQPSDLLGQLFDALASLVVVLQGTEGGLVLDVQGLVLLLQSGQLMKQVVRVLSLLVVGRGKLALATTQPLVLDCQRVLLLLSEAQAVLGRRQLLLQLLQLLRLLLVTRLQSAHFLLSQGSPPTRPVQLAGQLINLPPALALG